MKVSLALVIAIVLQCFSAFSLAGESLQAAKYFSEKTGRLHWDLNHQFQIEYIHSCEFPGYDDDLSGVPECSSKIMPVNKLREDGVIEYGYEVLINGDRLETSEYHLNENFQPIYSAIQSGEKVVASVKNSSGVIREVELDVSDIEKAGVIQKKIYVEGKREDRDRRLASWERHERNKFIKGSLIPFLLIFSALVAGFFFFRSKYRKNREVVKFFAEKAREWFLGLICGFRTTLKRFRFPSVKYIERSSFSAGSELLALTKLKDAGHLTEAEFQLLKRNVMVAAAEQSKAE